MKPFQYATPTSAERAVDFAGDGGMFFAGGIDVLGELKDGIAEPEMLVNVKAIPGMDEVSVASDALRLGANVRLIELIEHEEIGRRLPGIAEAAREVASPQIRNVATVGGNLAQHSRCWYYRHPDIECLKNGGSTCYARDGQNRHHSLFSGNPCISPVVSNLGVVLTALEAEAHIWRPDEPQAMTMPELYQMAWVNPMAHNSLLPRDLIVDVMVPTTKNRSTYLQISEKSAFDWALVSCAAAARVTGNTLHEPRVVLGVVAPVPYQKEEVNRLLDGQELTPELADRAAEALLADAEPQEDNAYKIPLSKALVKRALMQLVG